jgi:hypothetical protein
MDGFAAARRLRLALLCIALAGLFQLPCGNPVRAEPQPDAASDAGDDDIGGADSDLSSVSYRLTQAGGEPSVMEQAEALYPDLARERQVRDAAQKVIGPILPHRRRRSR